MSNESPTTRWWENYLVRYFLPSVAGMVIVRWLDIHTSGAIAKYVPILAFQEWKDFGTSHLLLWVLVGSLYCYISSYPILVFHATRVLDFKDRQGSVARVWINPYLWSAIFAIAAYCAAYWGSFCLAFVAVTLFSAVQIARLYMVYSRRERFGFQEGYDASVAYAYLNRLSKRRGVKEETSESEDDEGVTTQKTQTRLTDLADSYRHLREHGNTAFIFALELALCPIFLVVIGDQGKQGPALNLGALAAVLILWVAPSALVHFLGQHLERRYSLFRF